MFLSGLPKRERERDSQEVTLYRSGVFNSFQRGQLMLVSDGSAPGKEAHNVHTGK